MRILLATVAAALACLAASTASAQQEPEKFSLVINGIDTPIDYDPRPEATCLAYHTVFDGTHYHCRMNAMSNGSGGNQYQAQSQQGQYVQRSSPTLVISVPIIYGARTQYWPHLWRRYPHRW